MLSGRSRLLMCAVTFCDACMFPCKCLTVAALVFLVGGGLGVLSWWFGHEAAPEFCLRGFGPPFESVGFVGYLLSHSWVVRWW